MKLTVSDKLPPKHAVASESGKGSQSEDFKDDPLIQEAIEIRNILSAMIRRLEEAA